MMSFTESVQTCLSDKYFTFSGRASRPEFWWFYLVNVLAATFAAGGAGVVGALYKSEGGIIYVLLLLLLVMALLALVIPMIAVSVRRLHDTGRSGWWYLINLVPYIGSIVLLIFLLLPSDPDENEYGLPYSE